MVECPTCGQDNVVEGRFCSGCGTELHAAAAEEVRKTVTVVFCDLVGSTALGERLDPESVRKVVGRYFDEARAAIERHGGTVEKFIGDAVMSVFGIPRLHEDDALRAVRAAVELRNAITTLGDELEDELGGRLEARIGVATGEVVAGDHSSGQAFVTGDVVNLAARLEQAAAAGEVLIAVPTHEVVEDAVLAEETAPLTLKGKTEPVRAWRLLSLRSGRPEIRPIGSSFVGRDREMAALSDALERAMAGRSCQLCTVVAPPGIGKSRLADEFSAAIAGKANVVVGRCLPYGDGITYWPLAEVMRQVAGEGTRLEELLGKDEDSELAAERIGGAIGTEEPSGAPEEIFWAFRKLFEALARARPLVVVLDELQWAEPTLLDLVEYVHTFTADAPMLVLCLTRPELVDERPSWVAPRRAASVVTLEPLEAEQSSALAERLATARGLPREDVARVVAAAEGNPLFLEQLLAHRARDRGGALAIPPTIHALLAARIDRLTGDERAVILRAAVEGRTFHRGALVELLPQHARAALGARLISLVRQELIQPDRSLFPGDDAFRFGHSLIHDAVYEAAPKELRAEAHERFADWLERRAGAHVLQYEEILGYHLEQAYRLRAELRHPDVMLAHRAAERLAAAGERALARGDVPASINLLERAVALAEVSPAALYALGIGRREAGDLEGADGALSDAIERAEEVGDRGVATRAALDRLTVRELAGRGESRDISAATEEAIPILEGLRDEAGLAKAWLTLAAAAPGMAAAERAAERAFAHARRAHDARDKDASLFARLSAALYGERPVEEVKQLCLQLLEEARGPFAEVGTLEILGALKLRSGEALEGRELYERADRLYRELGMKHRAAVNWQCWGRSELAVGNPDLAESAFRKSVDEFSEMGDRWFEGAVLAHLAHALCDQGRYDEADSVLDRCYELPAASGCLAPSARARVLAAAAETEDALKFASDALDRARQQDWPEGRAQVLVSLAEVLHRAGRLAEETAALQEALELYQRKGIAPAAERVRAQLEGLGVVAAP